MNVTYINKIFSRSTDGGVITLCWRGKRQSIKVGITIASTSVHQLESAFNNPLNLLKQYAINTAHGKDIQHPIYA